MGRILAIDYGAKRVGLAVTDPFKIIATGLETVPAKEVLAYLKRYLEKEEVETFVIGDPKNLNNTPAESAHLVEKFILELNKNFPKVPVKKVDERFTSKMAAQTMVMGGYKKKDRQKKENLDTISAVIILQTFLENKI